MLFHCMDPRVKRLMNLTPLLTTFINYFISRKADFVLMILMLNLAIGQLMIPQLEREPS